MSVLQREHVAWMTNWHSRNCPDFFTENGDVQLQPPASVDTKLNACLHFFCRERFTLHFGNPVL